MPGKQMVLDAMAEGLLINCTHDTVLRFLPPYIITEKEVDQASEDAGQSSGEAEMTRRCRLVCAAGLRRAGGGADQSRRRRRRARGARRTSARFSASS